MTRPGPGSSFAIAALAALLLGIGWLPATTPAEAQEECLSQSECKALNQEIRQLRRDLRPIRREIRRLRSQIRELPEGDPQRAVLREQVREHKQEAKPIRQELRPRRQLRREGCRNCL